MPYSREASTILSKLAKEQLREARGAIVFSFANIEVHIQEKSSIGYLLQEWLEHWLEQQDIYFRHPAHSQTFPDLFLTPSSTHALLEIKSFDATASANFDVANFDAYHRSLKTDAYRLDADYLIFAYHFEQGVFRIKELWLKKIWEICTNAKDFPLKVQRKQGIIHNIRPATWYSPRSRYQPFQNRRDFVEAIYQTLQRYAPRQNDTLDWLDSVTQNYQEHTGKPL